jgi:hypothetical protein
MCRSIKVLRVAEAPATPEEISAAALQFVRKVSGYRKPSRANEQVFNRAIVEISGSVERLLDELVGVAPARRPTPVGARRPVTDIEGHNPVP